MSKSTASLQSTYGSLSFDTETGRVLSCSLDRAFGAKPDKIDVAEWRKRYPGEDMEGSHDVLDFGYWMRSGKYEPPCEEWRLDREARIKEEADQNGAGSVIVPT